MGLLDIANDPQMGLAMGLLNAAGPSARPVSLGQALSSGVGNMQEMQQQALKQKMLQMQMKEHEQKIADAEALRNFDFGKYYQTPQQQAIAIGGPTAENAAKIPALAPKLDQQGMIAGMMSSRNPALMQQAMTMLTKDETPIALPDGGMLVTKTGKKLVENPKAPTQSDFTKLINDVQGMPEGPMKNIAMARLQTMSTHAPASNTVVMPDRDPFKNNMALRKEFQDLPQTKAFSEVDQAYKQIKFALSQPSAANDLAAATKIMKMLDPGSVVRESELGMAMAATGLLDRIGNYYNMLNTGQKLTPQQRADFLNTAQGLYEAAAGTYNQTATEYRTRAERYKLNPDDVASTVTIPKNRPPLASFNQSGDKKP